MPAPHILLLAALVAALPAPPSRVQLQGRSYGPVDLDHAAHLARRISCKSCHGPGPVEKIELTARLAHDRCRGCHIEQKTGPTDCRGCHAVAPVDGSPGTPTAPPSVDDDDTLRRTARTAPAAAAPPGEAAPAVAPAAAPAAAPAKPAPAVAPANKPTVTVASASPPAAPLATPSVGPAAATAAPPASAVAALPEEPRETFHSTANVGLTVLAGPRRSPIAGPAFLLLARNGDNVLTYSLAFPGGANRGRALLLVGAGRARPLRKDLSVAVTGLGGLDASGDWARVLPAAGLEARLEWSGGRTVLQSTAISLTVLTDLVRPRVDGEPVGGTTFSLTLHGGIHLGR